MKIYKRSKAGSKHLTGDNGLHEKHTDTHTHTNTHTHTHTHTYIYIYIYTYTHTLHWEAIIN